MASASLAALAPRLALLAAVVAAVVAASSCIDESCSAEGDASGLLQLARDRIDATALQGRGKSESTFPMALAQLQQRAVDSRGEHVHPELASKHQEFTQALAQTGSNQSWDGWCPGFQVHPLVPAQTAPLVPIQPGNLKYLWWGDMPTQQPFEQLQELNKNLTPVELPDGLPKNFARLRMGQTDAKTAIDMMYKATKVDGNFDKIPKKLRGVMWMKGNAIPEVLAVLQYGMWSDRQKTLVVPTAPFNWAWPAGKPKDAPFGGGMYCEDQSCGITTSLVQTILARSFSFDFLEAGDKSTTNNKMKKAYMQTGTFGNLTEAENLGKLIPGILNLPVPSDTFNGAFTLEEEPGSNDGRAWKRTCYWGLKQVGSCAFLEFGSYQLVKVMDGDGKPVQPYYDQFLKYMGDIPVMMWSGWKDEATKAGVKKQFEEFIAMCETTGECGAIR